MDFLPFSLLHFNPQTYSHTVFLFQITHHSLCTHIWHQGKFILLVVVLPCPVFSVVFFLSEDQLPLACLVFERLWNYHCLLDTNSDLKAREHLISCFVFILDFTAFLFRAQNNTLSFFLESSLPMFDHIISLTSGFADQFSHSQQLSLEIQNVKDSFSLSDQFIFFQAPSCPYFNTHLTL